jgi:hypothetical protein
LSPDNQPEGQLLGSEIGSEMIDTAAAAVSYSNSNVDEALEHWLDWGNP